VKSIGFCMQWRLTGHALLYDAAWRRPVCMYECSAHL